MRKSTIEDIQIHVTDSCNLNCIYCYARKYRGQALSKDKIFSLLNETKENNVKRIRFLGGEPFFYPHFKEILGHTAKLGLDAWVFTNATLIDSEWINYLKRFENRMNLIFKLDTKEGYKQHSGGDMYEKIIKTIKACNAAQLNSNTFIAVTKKNFDQIEELIKKSFEMGSAPVIERFIPVVSEDINQSLEISSVEWNVVVSLLKKYWREHGTDSSVLAERMNIGCACYNSQISIMSNGEALPCPFAPEELSLGNVLEKPLSEIINQFFIKKEEWDKIPAECSECSNKESCKGGCKTYVYLKHKRFDKKDNFCVGNQPPNLTKTTLNYPKH